MTKTPRILGTLSIVFGALIAFWSPLTLLIGPLMKRMSSLVATVPHQPGGPDPAISLGASEAMLEAQHGYLVASAIVMTVMSVALIVIGVGLVKRRAWSRKVAIGWSVLALLIVVGQTVASIAWLQPTVMEVQRAYYEAHAAKLPFQMPPTAAAGTGVLGALFNAAFPTVLLALLGRRRAAADFTS